MLKIGSSYFSAGGAPIKAKGIDYTAIVALEPCYGKEGGNATRIYTWQGEVFEVNCRLNTVLHNLVQGYGYDLAKLRRQFGEKLFCRQDIPLPLSATQALVPLKMRCPFSEKDGATGYINLCAFMAVVPAPEQKEGAVVACHLKLSGGHTLPSLFSAANIEGRMKKAILAHEHYFHLHGHYGKENHYRIAEEAEQHQLYRVHRQRRRFRTF